jgi:putative salt-induced outer membrane protein
MHKLAPVLVLTVFTTHVLAEESEEKKRPWDVEVGLGAIATSGNTETSSLQFKLDAKQNLDRWENQYVFNSLFKEDDVEQDDGTTSKEKTAEKYFGSAKFAYLLGVEKAYLFGFGSHTDDKFGAYRTYSTVALGYGDWLYSSTALTWFVEAGPGYFEGEQVIGSNNETIPDSVSEESGAMLRAATALEWKISSNAEFKQIVSVEAGTENTRTVSETSLAASINGSLKMKVGFDIANDTDVAPGKEKTDTTLYVNLVYNF